MCSGGIYTIGFGDIYEKQNKNPDFDRWSLVHDYAFMRPYQYHSSHRLTQEKHTSEPF